MFYCKRAEQIYSAERRRYYHK